MHIRDNCHWTNLVFQLPNQHSDASKSGGSSYFAKSKNLLPSINLHQWVHFDFFFARNHWNTALSTFSFPPERIFFRLWLVLDFSRSDKIFPLFFSHVDTVFLDTPYFSETSLLLVTISKCFNALHSSSIVLIFRPVFDTIIEKLQLDKTAKKQIMFC